MRCEDIQNQLGLFIDGESSPEISAQIRLHLRDCQECRAEFERLARINELMQQSPQSYPDATYWESLPGQVLSRLNLTSLRKSKKSVWTWNFSFRLAGVAAVCVIMFFVVRTVFYDSGEHLSPLPGVPADYAVTGQKETEKLEARYKTDTEQNVGYADAKDAQKTSPVLQPPSGVTVVSGSERIVMADEIKKSKIAARQDDKSRLQEEMPVNEPISNHVDQMLRQSVDGTAGSPVVTDITLASGGVTTSRGREAEAAKPAEVESKELYLTLVDTLRQLQKIADQYDSKGNRVLAEKSVVVDHVDSDLKTIPESDSTRAVVITTIANYYNELVNIRRIETLRPDAIHFLNAHKQVLNNTLGNERVQQIRRELESRP